MEQRQICPAIGHLQHTWFLCNVVSEVSYKCLQVPGDVTFMREKLWERGKDRIREKEIGIFVSLKFVKNSFFKCKPFSGIPLGFLCYCFLKIWPNV